jgi:hypothetical protein
MLFGNEGYLIWPNDFFAMMGKANPRGMNLLVDIVLLANISLGWKSLPRMKTSLFCPSKYGQSQPKKGGTFKLLCPYFLH